MGWLTGWRSKDEVLTHLYGMIGPDRILDKALVGGVLYVAVKGRDGRPDFIAVILVSGERGEWGYKDMDESMGPNEASCPLRLLNLIPNPDPDPASYSTEWRARVRAFHKRKAETNAKAKNAKNAVKALVVGSLVTLPESFIPASVTIKTIEPSGVVGVGPDGSLYRIRKRHLALATITPPTPIGG